MPSSDSKTYSVDDQPTEKDALDFTPYVETLADIIQTGNTPLAIGVFGTLRGVLRDADISTEDIRSLLRCLD